jgi:hypothetical protein
MKKITLITLIVCLAISACAQDKSKFFKWKCDAEYDVGDESPWYNVGPVYYLHPINKEFPDLKGQIFGRVDFKKDKKGGFCVASLVFSTLNECLSDEFINFLCKSESKLSFYFWINRAGVVFYAYFSFYEEMKDEVKKNEADLYKFCNRLKQKHIDMTQIEYFSTHNILGGDVDADDFDFTYFSFDLAYREWLLKYPAKKIKD